MKYLAVFTLLFIGLAYGLQCTYDYDPILVFANDKQYDFTALPFISNYTLVKQFLPLTDADLDAQRAAAVAWLEEGFGITGGVYDSVNQVTVYAGKGVLAPIFFHDGYELVASSDPTFGLSRCFYLATVEITFRVDAGANFTYGGKFGQLADALGQSKQAVSGDGVSFGWYYIMRDIGNFHRVERRLSFKSLIPNRPDLTWRSHQWMQLQDDEWGVGQSLLEIQFYPDFSNGKITTQMVNTWKFNEPYNVYSAVGISV